MVTKLAEVPKRRAKLLGLLEAHGVVVGVSHVVAHPLDRLKLLLQFRFPNVEIEGLDEDITLVAELRTEQEIDIAASLALFTVLLLGDTESTAVQELGPIVRISRNVF